MRSIDEVILGVFLMVNSWSMTAKWCFCANTKVVSCLTTTITPLLTFFRPEIDNPKTQYPSNAIFIFYFWNENALFDDESIWRQIEKKLRRPAKPIVVFEENCGKLLPSLRLWYGWCIEKISCLREIFLAQNKQPVSQPTSLLEAMQKSNYHVISIRNF